MFYPTKKNHTDPTATLAEFSETAEEYNQRRAEQAFGLISGFKHIGATTTTFTITKGMAQDASYRSYTAIAPKVIRLTSDMTKSISSTWAAGTGNGALVTGTSLTTSTWYYVYVIGSADNSLNDVCVSHINGTPALPTGYATFRLVGTFRTNSSSQIIGFYQTGEANNRVYFWREPQLEVSGSGTASNVALSINFAPPIDRKVVTIHQKRIGSVNGGQLMFVWSETLNGTIYSNTAPFSSSGTGGDTTDISHRLNVPMPADNLARYFIQSSTTYTILVDSYTIEL